MSRGLCLLDRTRRLSSIPIWEPVEKVEAGWMGSYRVMKKELDGWIAVWRQDAFGCLVSKQCCAVIQLARL